MRTAITFSLLFIALSSAAQSKGGENSTVAQLPAAPSPVDTVSQAQRPRFLSFRANWEEAPLRTNRQAFDKKFLAVHIAAWGAVVFACRRSRTSGETWGSEIPAMAAVTAMDYMSTRLLWEPFAIGPALYATGHYLHSGLK